MLSDKSDILWGDSVCYGQILSTMCFASSYFISICVVKEVSLKEVPVTKT